MKISSFNRVFLSIVVLLLLLVVTSPLTAVWLIRIQANQIVENDLRALTTSSLASMNVSEGFKQTASAVMENNTSDLSQVLVRLAETTKQVDIQYESHRKTLKSSAEKEKFEHLLKCRKDYRATREEIFRLLKEGNAAAARTLFDKDCESQYELYVKALEGVVHNNIAKARASGRHIIKLCNWLLLIQLVLLGFFFVYGFFVPLTALIEGLTRRSIVVKD
jgi:hypothetical protein